MTLNYVKIYDLERYLFTEVGPRFVSTGKIEPADFYMIVIWKANRAKTRIRNRLDRQEDRFAGSVARIAAALHASQSPRERLKIIMGDWKFALPMATAVLTVLYPQDFSVYDVRVCEQLNCGFEKLAHRQFSDRLWTSYQEFLTAVDAATPEGLSLRDKDRYLWGQSFYAGVERDLKGDSAFEDLKGV